jgi:hypothetical protein
MARLIVAIITGSLITIILSITTDMIMVSLGVFPPLDSGEFNFNNRLLLIAFFYRSVYSILSAFVIALIAKEKYRKAVLISGIIGTVIGLIGLVVMWEKSKAAWWYPVSLVVFAIPLALLGGKIYKKYMLKKHNKS